MKYSKDFGLIAHWPLNSNGLDISGYNGHLFLVNSSNEISLPKYSVFREFNGKIGFYHDTYVLRSTFSERNSVDYDRPFSFCCFFNKYDDTTPVQITTTQDDIDTPLVGLSFKEISKNISFSIRVNAGSYMGVTTSTQIIEPNTLYHLAVTYTGKGGAKNLNIYVNGIRQEVTIDSDNASSSTISNEDLVIGGVRSGTTLTATPCFISDLRIYNRELFPFDLYDIINSKVYYSYFSSLFSLNGGIPLHSISTETFPSGIPLYLFGCETFSSGVPLHLFSSEIIPSDIPLYLTGHQGISSDIPLYTFGIDVVYEYLNLFTSAPLYDNNNYLPLFEHGSSPGFDGIYNQIPNFIEGTGGLNSNVNLFLSNYGVEPWDSNLNLYTTSDYEKTRYSIPLYVSNSGVFNNVPLYVRGLGTYDGYVPHATGMNLFVQQMFGNYIPLYLIAPGTEVSGNLNIYCFGANIFSSGLDLSIPAADQPIGNVLKAYIHGF